MILTESSETKFVTASKLDFAMSCCDCACIFLYWELILSEAVKALRVTVSKCIMKSKSSKGDKNSICRSERACEFYDIPVHQVLNQQIG
jgi:hypothetical protein